LCRDSGGAWAVSTEDGDTGTRSRAFELASRLAAIVESSDDAILGKTLDGVITSWNSGAAALYGYTADEIIGRNVSVLVPPDRIGELGPIMHQLRRGQRVDHFETQRRHKDGSIVDVSVCISPIKDASGTVTGASTVARDITERIRAEADRRAREQEQQRQHRFETLGQLAGGIAHDFNNLLAIILNYAGFVARATADQPEVQADAEHIQSAVQRGIRLTRQLLLFSQRQEIQPVELDLNTVIADMSDLLHTTLGPGSRLQIGPVAPDAIILADRGHLEQVLLNLTVNARDAMPQGGTVSIGTRLTSLGEEHACRRLGVSPDRYVEFTVSDTGTGMSQEVAARVFEPFFTTKPQGEGTGLGLSTVYGIVVQSGGDMTVDSREGAGTTFRIYFPLVDAPAQGVQSTPAEVPELEALDYEATILVVDDEPLVCEAAARILREHGYTTLEARTWEEALKLASSHDIQLLLSDSILPGMTGATLADSLADMNPALPVLRMSASSLGSPGPEDEQACIQKPFTAQALLEKVHAALRPGPA